MKMIIEQQRTGGSMKLSTLRNWIGKRGEEGRKGCFQGELVVLFIQKQGEARGLL